jgi:hypothetical protein
MSEKNDTRFLHGIVRGKTIELETESGRSDGERVVVLLMSEQDASNEVEAAQTLDAIHRMRHIGRSVVRP